VTTFVAALVCATSAWATTVSDWNAAALQEVRKSKALRNGPPMVARALAIVHTCIYDAWAAYDAAAVGTTDTGSDLLPPGSRRRPAEERTDDNKAKAISFAAYRCLRNLYPDAASTVRLNAVLVNDRVNADGNPDPLGHLPRTGPAYDLTEATYMFANTPAGVGNLAAQYVIDARANDGSNQYGDLAPVPVLCESVSYPRPPPELSVTVMQLVGADPLLQPLPCLGPGGAQTAPYADYDDLAAGYRHYVPSNPLMGFCRPELTECPAPDDYIDPVLLWPYVVDPNHWQPLVYNNHARQTFVAAHWERVTPFALTSADQFDDTLFIPPPDYEKSPGQYQKDVNDMIQYSRDLDTGRKLMVEYWADGPDSELPPGHWGLFAQWVSQRDGHSIDQDVKMFFAMHNASFDAGIVAWHIKRKYNGVRPITAIRFAKQGQTIYAWGGPGRPIEHIPGEKWSPYNPGGNLTPPFPGYFSGHSVFSRSSATVLALFTGSDDFGFSTDIGKCDVAYFGIDFSRCFGRVEPGIPDADKTISFATFSEAAEEAGLSRLYGGIHFADDNTTAQNVGYLIGQQAWKKALTYFNGTAP
jgi:hypothetical protein